MCVCVVSVGICNDVCVFRISSAFHRSYRFYAGKFKHTHSYFDFSPDYSCLLPNLNYRLFINKLLMCVNVCVHVCVCFCVTHTTISSNTYDIACVSIIRAFRKQSRHMQWIRFLDMLHDFCERIHALCDTHYVFMCDVHFD